METVNSVRKGLRGGYMSNKVWNKGNKKCPAGAVYVGRPSKWGNPFRIGRDGTREEVVRMYEEWLRKQIKASRLNPEELRGKDLVCWCKPELCHGDILLRLANS